MTGAGRAGLEGGTWASRIDRFWAGADDADPAGCVAAMQALVLERPPDDPRGLYELASVLDFVGDEEAAIPRYRAALAAGLSDPERPRAVIQLASSLRNVGDPAAAVDLLREVAPEDAVGDAAQAFLALALHDLGRHDEAMRIALRALAPALPLYGRAVMAYADDLVAGAG